MKIIENVENEVFDIFSIETARSSDRIQYSIACSLSVFEFSEFARQRRFFLHSSCVFLLVLPGSDWSEFPISVSLRLRLNEHFRSRSDQTVAATKPGPTAIVERNPDIQPFSSRRERLASPPGCFAFQSIPSRKDLSPVFCSNLRSFDYVGWRLRSRAREKREPARNPKNVKTR